VSCADIDALAGNPRCPAGNVVVEADGIAVRETRRRLGGRVGVMIVARTSAERTTCAL